jgi:HlyD family secretion protein
MPNVVKAGIAVAVLGSLAYLWVSFGSDESEIQYTTEETAIGNIQNVVATSGTLKAVGTVDVGSQISGQISELFVDFNSEVKTGAVLARIDSRTYEGRVKQSEAALEIAKANVVQQQASLERSQADLEESNRLLERQQQLAKAGHVSQSDLDSLVNRQKAAQAQVTITKAQLGNAKASVVQAEASLFQANIDLERCTIFSPVDGVVINRQIELGQTVAASMSAPVLFTIAQDLREMQVEASIDEADIGKIKEQQQTTFTVEAFPERNFRGEIKQVRKAAVEVQNVVTYKVVISADNRDLSLLPGMTANIEVMTGQKESVLRVPNTALRFKPAGTETQEQDPRTAFMETRIQSMKQDLQLSEEQEQAIRKIFAEQMATMQRPSANSGPPVGFGGGFGPPPGGRRPDGPSGGMFNNEELRQILSEEQFAEFRRLGRENGNRRNGSDRPRPGQVWVLASNKQIEMRQIMVGLVGDEFSEVVAGNLRPGEKVITRARRSQN